MKRDELNKKVAEELKRIPRGSFDQNMLRAYYNAMRRHDLSLSPACPARDTLVRAVELIRKGKPDFLPTYDRDFFQIWN